MPTHIHMLIHTQHTNICTHRCGLIVLDTYMQCFWGYNIICSQNYICSIYIVQGLEHGSPGW